MAWTVKFLERCSYRAMTSDSDLDFLSRWRWQHYMEQETIKNPSMTVQDFEDGKDRLPTARTVGLYVDGALVSAMRLHAINAEAYNIDVVDIGRERVERELAKGKRFVYSSRWVSDPKFSATVPLIVATTRITPLACEYHRADYALSSSRENHVKMYERMQNAVLWSDRPEPIDNLDYLYHLISSDYHEFRDRIPVDRQAYASSAKEREEMFSPLADSAKMITPSVGDVLAGLEVTGFAY
ncbi:hypothetical protein GOB57_08830 [Sinorhizobium meliloti]|nr:hypothetical protein [Sinorhizobium meliloti]